MLSSALRFTGRVAGLGLLMAAIAAAAGFALIVILTGMMLSFDDDPRFTRVLCALGALEGPACPAYRQDLEETRQDLLITQAQLEAAQDRLAHAEDRLAHLRRLDDLAESWTAFRTERPAALGGAEVITGARYSTVLGAGGLDGLENEYCYVSRAQNGVMRQITLSHDGRRWARIDEAAADVLGLAPEGLEQARSFCRFVGPGPAEGDS